MDFENFIGLPLDEVERTLQSADIKYKIKENSSIQKHFDTIIVIKIVKLSETFVELITDKFLLNI